MSSAPCAECTSTILQKRQKFRSSKFKLLGHYVLLTLVEIFRNFRRLFCIYWDFELLSDIVLGNFVIELIIISECEKFRELEVARIVHQLLSLCQHNGDQDDGVKNQNQTINVEPVQRVLLLRDHRQAVDVSRDSWDVDKEDLKDG